MKMTREERSWVLYDVGNSAFVLLVSTIMPLYFNYLAGSAGLLDSDYLAYWGYAASIATIIVAVMGPVVGNMADMKGFKKFLFTISMLVGMFQGGVQALSRSYFAKIIPAEQQGSGISWHNGCRCGYPDYRKHEQGCRNDISVLCDRNCIFQHGDEGGQRM